MFASRIPFLVPDGKGMGGSSLGTMSIRKSNWSDLLSAFAMSDRERVRRLLESAMMKARAVISEMNTSKVCQIHGIDKACMVTYSRRLCRRE